MSGAELQRRIKAATISIGLPKMVDIASELAAAARVPAAQDAVARALIDLEAALAA
jgi:hypothetical protein